MFDDKSHIDQLFKDLLANHKVKAPDGAWNRLDAELHKKPSLKAWMWRAVAASILLLLTFSAGYFLSEFQRSETKQRISETDINQPGNNSFVFNEITNAPEKKPTDAYHPSKETETTSEKQSLANDKSGKTEAAPEKSINIPESSKSAQIIEEGTKGYPVSSDQSIIGSSAIAGKLSNINTIKPLPALKQIAVSKKTVKNDPLAKNRLFEDPDFLKAMLLADFDYEYAENHPMRPKSASNWSIGGQFSPLYSFRLLGENNTQQGFENPGNSYFNETESGIVTLAGGISLNYRLSKRWSIGSGMYVSRIGQANSEVLAAAIPGSNGMYKLATSAGEVMINPKKFEAVMVEQQISVKDSISGNYLVTGSFIQNLDYFEVPLIMQYNLIKSRLSVHLIGGISPGILINNRSYFENNGKKLQTGVVENINPMIYNSLMGIGLEYSISKKVAINFDPTFKYALNAVNPDSPFNAHPYSFSFFTGISYKFY